jgi:hypothetical protein
LPEREREAQEREGGEDGVETIHRRKGNEKSGANASRFGWQREAAPGLIFKRMVYASPLVAVMAIISSELQQP